MDDEHNTSKEHRDKHGDCEDLAGVSAEAMDLGTGIYINIYIYIYFRSSVPFCSSRIVARSLLCLYLLKQWTDFDVQGV